MENRQRKSRPLESTRISGVCVQQNNEPSRDIGEETNSVGSSHAARNPVDESLNDSERSVGLNSTYTVDPPNHLKTEFNGLNHRLISYMDRVKQNEELLRRSEAEKHSAQEQLAKSRSEHSKQVDMLRLELDEHVRQAVMAEEQRAKLEKKVQNLQEERKALKSELAARSQREASLERALVSERNEIRGARSELSKLQAEVERYGDQRSQTADELTKLKVEYAKLQERMKVASMELTMQASKVSEAEKKLQFTSEDVRKKLHEQRSQLEKLGMEKLDEIRRKHHAKLARLRHEHQVDKQNTLVTYVSGEDFAKLDTQMTECLRKLEETESRLQDRETKLREAQERIATLGEAHEKEVAKERKRRDRLQKKLFDQDKNHEDIRQELENYRKLIEGLDVNENVICNTPLGAKRARPSLDSSSTSGAQSKLPISSRTPLIESRKVIARRVLTPIRKVPITPAPTVTEAGRPADQTSSQRDCKVM